MSFVLPANLDETTRRFCGFATTELGLTRSLMEAPDQLYVVAKAILDQSNEAKVQRNFTAQVIVAATQWLLSVDKRNEIATLSKKVAFCSPSQQTHVQVPQEIERLLNALKEGRQDLIDQCIAAIKPETGFEISRPEAGDFTVKVNSFKNPGEMTASLALLTKCVPHVTIDLVMPNEYVEQDWTKRRVYYTALLNNFLEIAAQFKERVNCVDLAELPQDVLTDELLLQLTKDLPRVKHLSIHGSRLTTRSLAYLSQLKDLETLFIDRNELIEEIPGIGELTNLRTLKLNWCTGLKKMPDLSNHTKLRFLDFKVNNELRGYPALSHLISLETLCICGNEEFPDLSMLTSLKELTLHHALAPEQLHHLRKLTNLERLVLWCGLDLPKLPEIGTLTNLCHLTISGYSLTKIPSLSAFVNLQSLKIDCRNMTKLPDLSRLTQLIDLDLQGCCALKQVTLAGLIKIQSLNFVSCYRLEKLPDISLLLELRTLRLRHFYYISRVTIEGLPELQTLECSWNEITQLTLRRLPKLRTLDIKCSKFLKSVDLQEVDALETLDLTHCWNLARFKSAENFPKLRTLIGLHRAVERNFRQTNQQKGELLFKLSKDCFNVYCN